MREKGSGITVEKMEAEALIDPNLKHSSNLAKISCEIQLKNFPNLTSKTYPIWMLLYECKPRLP